MDEDFDDLIEEGSANTEIKQKALESNFGSLDIHDFEIFNQADEEAVEGEYTFAVKQQELKEAVSVTKFTVSSTNTRFGAVKITILPRGLKLSTFSQSSFSEIVIPLTEAGCPAVIKSDTPISFVFDHSLLSNIVAKFQDPIIYFTYQPRADESERGVLNVDSYVKGESPLRTVHSTYPLTDFTNYHAKTGKIKGLPSIPISPEVLRKGLNYANLFIKKNDAYTALSVIEVRDGAVHSGFEGAIGVFKNPAFDFELKVKYETKDIVEGMLGKFEGETRLTVTENYYIIRDLNLIFGFERCSYTFPSVEKLFNSKSETYARVNRDQLRNTLERLSTASMNENLLVEINISGEGSDGRITLSTRDDYGRVSSHQLVAVRKAIEEGVSSTQYPDWVMHVNIHAFIDVVNHFKSEHVDLEQRISGQAILIHDVVSGDDVQTLISSLKPPKTVEKEHVE
jgi:hypothetical protein